jgi:DNA-binding transcriptional ArsR family regulator
MHVDRVNIFLNLPLLRMPKTLNDASLDLIAHRFRAMGEPMRLRLLMLLQSGERTVSELVAQLHTSQANISKHLHVLTASGLLHRHKRGLNVFYTIADPRIFDMCDMVCGSLKEHHDTRAKLLA